MLRPGSWTDTLASAALSSGYATVEGGSPRAASEGADRARHLLQVAKRKGLVQSNPADAENMPRPQGCLRPSRMSAWLTDDEMKETFGASSAQWLVNVMGWATETGMDKGKVCCGSAGRSLTSTELTVESRRAGSQCSGTRPETESVRSCPTGHRRP